MNFNPNSLKSEEVDSLEDWQLLTAACHFGPTMSDCVELDYSYKLHNGHVYLAGSKPGLQNISLQDDFDLDHPEVALKQYAGITWQDAVKTILKSKLLAHNKDTND